MNNVQLNHVEVLSESQCFCFSAVDDGAILDVQFMDFSYPPPDNYDRIMFEQNIL